MSGGGKGGKQTTEVKIPAWLEAGARNNMARANELAQIGYTPLYGADVAAFTPMQQAAFQGTADAASAFGQAAPVNPMGGMPQAMTFADGTTGYSSAPLYEQSLAALAAARPGQFAALQAPFINPVTGAEPASPFGSGNGGQGRATQMDPMMAVMAAMTGVGGDRRSGGGFGGFQPARPGGGGTGSFGLPDPMSGRFAGTNFPGRAGGLLNTVTRAVAPAPAAPPALRPTAPVATRTTTATSAGSRVGMPRGGR
jgi:hypothetical protein